MFWGRYRRRWLRSSLTPVGFVFGCATGLTLVAAFNTGFNLLYIVAAAGVGFLVVSLLLSRWSVRGLRAIADAPESVHRGLPFNITLRVENRKWNLPALAVRLEREGEQGRTRAYIQTLLPGRTAVARVSQLVERRGVHRLESFVSVSSFPFGLIESWRPLAVSREVSVYPRVVPLRTTAVEQTSGSRYRTRTASGDGDEYFSIREYLPGDDIRKISWRVSARMGQLMIRELARQNSRYLLFVLDTRVETVPMPEDEDERFEETIDLVASLGTTLLQRQYNIAIETPTGYLEGGEGSGQRKRLLRFLTEVQAVSFEEFPVFDERSCKLDTAMPAVLLVSHDPERWGRRASNAGVRVLDPREVVHA